MPNIPDNDDDEGVRRYYHVATGACSMVARFANMSIPQVMDLNIIDYLILRRDAFIQSMSRTKEGLEALEAAWMREQTKADRTMLRKMIHGD